MNWLYQMSPDNTDELQSEQDERLKERKEFIKDFSASIKSPNSKQEATLGRIEKLFEKKW